jgi:hypothetical protein
MNMEELERYGIEEKVEVKKPGLISKLITKIKNRLETKRKEKEFKNKIMTEAREQALLELRPEMVQHIKEQEIKKMTGQDKTDKLEKLAKAFSFGGMSNGGQNGGNSTSDKINRMLGVSNNNSNNNQNNNNNNQNNNNNNQSRGGVYNDRLERALGISRPQPQQQKPKRVNKNNKSRKRK